jgi:hypothetical protein
MRLRRDEETRSAWGSGTATQPITGSRGPSRAWRVRAQRTASEGETLPSPWKARGSRVGSVEREHHGHEPKAEAHRDDDRVRDHGRERHAGVPSPYPPELRSSITLAGVILWTYPFHRRCERSHCGANARCLSSFRAMSTLRSALDELRCTDVLALGDQGSRRTSTSSNTPPALSRSSVAVESPSSSDAAPTRATAICRLPRGLGRGIGSRRRRPPATFGWPER